MDTNDSGDRLHDLIMAAHTDLSEVETIVDHHPELLDRAHPDSGETPLGAAAHMGRRDIATFLLARGAEPTLCALAMLGDVAAVEAILESDPDQIDRSGAHGIPLMFHAALSGKVPLATRLREAGCRDGYDAALHAAAAHGHTAMIAWLLEHGADEVNAAGYLGRTALDQAVANGHTAAAELLREHGGKSADGTP